MTERLFLDFRSDTVTRPTPAMRKAMAEAEVGDDVMGEDPTVRRLEETVAGLLGTEAGLFCPSGTMANQVAVWVHTARWGQVLCEEHSHVALYEGGGAALVSGATVRTVAGRGGVFGAADLAPHILPDDPHFARTRLVVAENTHNWSGGRVWPLRAARSLVGAVHSWGAALHVDGARLWNAAVALDAAPARLVAGADSVMVSLSKGLSAPVGSVLCGSRGFITQAQRVRKVLGGGMRQAGVLAAAGLVAVEAMVERLADDHTAAKGLAEGLCGLPGLEVDPDQVETNMVLADVAGTGMDAGAFCALAARHAVGCLPRDAGSMVRFVTHRHVGPDEAAEAVDRLRAALAAR